MRQIKFKIKGLKTSDGAGVNLTRIIGSPDLDMLDPFLLLDEFGSDDPNDYIAGFPSHPHRGFETITYIKNGKFHHKDNAGNEGFLSDGSVQWMTAGSGVIHSEMPQQTKGLIRGFQLWLNLPRDKKMITPSYNDIPAEDIPIINSNSQRIKIISGEYNSINGPGKPHTGVIYLDITLKNVNDSFSVDINDGWNAFIYIYEGEISSGLLVSKGSLAVLDKKGLFECISTKKDTKFLLIAGEPINEPVARGGPFVMNTRQEILQAFEDYQSGKFGK